MIDGEIVVDGVCHAYNYSPENMTGPETHGYVEYVHQTHARLTPPEFQWGIEDIRRDIDTEFMAHAMFAESQVDVAIQHTVVMYGWWKDGMVRVEKGAKARSAHPNRLLLYGGVHPLRGDALDEIDRQVEQFRVDGIKMYPGAHYGGRTHGWRMDDHDVAFPIFSRLVERGVKNCAIHKAVPLGGERSELAPYRIDDVGHAAMEFPDLNFQIVHGGLAFIEDTLILASRYDNVFINLDMTICLAVQAPERFAHFLGAALRDVGSHKLIFASGCVFTHPRPVVEALWNFEIPESLCRGWGYPQITRDDKVKILGGNAMSLHGLDAEAIRGGIADDEYERAKAAHGGYLPPWSHRVPARVAS